MWLPKIPVLRPSATPDTPEKQPRGAGSLHSKHTSTVSPQHSAEQTWALSFLAETLSLIPSAATELLRSSARPPESPVQGKSKQGWIPAGLQQSQKMKPSGDPLILPQHPHSSAAVSEYFHADRCRAGFSLSDLSSSFKNYTAYLQTEPRCLYSICLHPPNSFRSLRAVVGENNLWHCKRCVGLPDIQKKTIMTCEMQLHLIHFFLHVFRRNLIHCIHLVRSFI